MLKRYKLDARFTELKHYCHISKEHDFMEVVLWHNGEGITATTSDKTFELTWGMLEAINVLSKIAEEAQ